MIDSDKAKVIDRESDKSGRHIREPILIRKTDNMNPDEGSYQLSHVWDKFLHTDDHYRKSVSPDEDFRREVETSITKYVILVV